VKKQGELILIFFIDALGWEIIKDTDFLRAQLPHRFKLRTVLGYSCAAQPTILTGKIPSEHGHWAMYERTDAGSPFSWLKMFGILPSVVKNHGRFRRQLMKIHRKLSGYTGYYNLYNIPYRYYGRFDICEKRDIYAPGGFDKCVGIFDLFSNRRLRYRVWTWRDPFTKAFEELNECIESLEGYDVLFLYTAWLDGFLHKHRKEPEQVRRGYTTVKDAVEKSIDLARKSYSDTRIILFSDHGMAPIRKIHDLWGEIKRLPLKEGVDYLPFYDSTMCRFWFSNARARKTIVDFLDTQEWGRILSAEELEKEGILFKDNRFGEIIFLCDAGNLILPSFMGRYPVNGMHGFHPDDPDSDAVLFTDSVPEAETVAPSASAPEFQPAHIKDIYTVMRNLVLKETNR